MNSSNNITHISYFNFRVCYLGERLLTSSSVTVDGVMMCTKNETGPIFHNFCKVGVNSTDCDSQFAKPAYTKPGIPGLASGVFSGKSSPLFFSRPNNFIEEVSPCKYFFLIPSGKPMCSGFSLEVAH